jgi:hypothetical protein
LRDIPPGSAAMPRIFRLGHQHGPGFGRHLLWLR